MAIEFTCPNCGTTTEAAAEFVGQSGPCRSCGATVTVAGAKRSAQSSDVRSAILSNALVFGVTLLAGGLVVALVLPALQFPRTSRLPPCSNNLKTIALALHHYHDVYGSFPPAYTVDANGDKLHSWRTLILEFFDESLYAQVDLSKPWDAPENYYLSTNAPGSYRHPLYHCSSDRTTAKTSTTYMAVVGPNCAFEGERPVKMSEILDGTSNTIMVVEVTGADVNWMEPVDLDVQQMHMRINSGPTEISSAHSGGANVVLVDGSVHYVEETTEPKVLRELLTRDGGERVNYGDGE